MLLLKCLSFLLFFFFFLLSKRRKFPFIKLIRDSGPAPVPAEILLNISHARKVSEVVKKSPEESCEKNKDEGKENDGLGR